MRQIGLLTTLYKTRRGPLFKPSMLNRVAPLFFGPRLSRTIRLKEVGLQARELHIPLGNENWDCLTPQIREHFGRKVATLCRKQEILSLGVTRDLQPESLGPIGMDGRGDNFIVALALLRIEESLGRIGGRRVILVSDQKMAFRLAVKVSERFKVPVSLQSVNPSQHESTALRMLHQEGLAISLSTLSPSKWKDDDIVLLLDESYSNLVSSCAKDLRINLFDSSRGHAPELEEELQRQGLDPALCNLAPLMEAYLLNGVNMNQWDSIKVIEEKGGRVWDYFLDKEGAGHYNTRKGF